MFNKRKIKMCKTTEDVYVYRVSSIIQFSCVIAQYSVCAKRVRISAQCFHAHVVQICNRLKV